LIQDEIELVRSVGESKGGDDFQFEFRFVEYYSIAPVSSGAPEDMQKMRRIWTEQKESIMKDSVRRLLAVLEPKVSELTKNRNIENAQMVSDFCDGLKKTILAGSDLGGEPETKRIGGGARFDDAGRDKSLNCGQ